MTLYHGYQEAHSAHKEDRRGDLRDYVELIDLVQMRELDLSLKRLVGR